MTPRQAPARLLPLALLVATACDLGSKEIGENLDGAGDPAGFGEPRLQVQQHAVIDQCLLFEQGLDPDGCVSTVRVDADGSTLVLYSVIGDGDDDPPPQRFLRMYAPDGEEVWTVQDTSPSVGGLQAAEGDGWYHLSYDDCEGAELRRLDAADGAATTVAQLPMPDARDWCYADLEVAAGVVWTFTGDDDLGQITGQRFDLEGSPLGDPVDIQQPGSPNALFANRNGGLSTSGYDGETETYEFRVFAPDGTLLGAIEGAPIGGDWEPRHGGGFDYVAREHGPQLESTVEGLDLFGVNEESFALPPDFRGEYLRLGGHRLLLDTGVVTELAPDGTALAASPAPWDALANLRTDHAGDLLAIMNIGGEDDPVTITVLRFVD